jgi:cytoskeletal protein CcmA (bactofilin family)
MAEPVRAPNSGSAPAVIVGPRSRFSGLVQLREPARIDGEIDGEIFASDVVWIGETGRVRARIEAPEVVVAGELQGDIIASRRVELTATARVTGSIECPILALAEGGNLDGRCAIGGSPPEPEPMP